MAANGATRSEPLRHVVVRVEGEWLRKGFGVEREEGVHVLKEAWKNVKESELGLRPLRPAVHVNPMGDDDDEDLLNVEDFATLGTKGKDGGSEKRRWLHYQNTWTAYPFANDSHSQQYPSQNHHRRVGTTSIVASSKAPRYPRSTHPSSLTATAGSGHLQDENCGDDPLFIDNDLNVHEAI